MKQQSGQPHGSEAHIIALDPHGFDYDPHHELDYILKCFRLQVKFGPAGGT